MFKIVTYHWNLLQLDYESSIRRSSVHRIVKKELQLKCLKKTNAQELTAANKQPETGENDSSSAAAEPVSEPYGELHVLLTKSYSPMMPRPSRRTIVFKSIRVAERRTSTDFFERDRHSARPMDI